MKNDLDNKKLYEYRIKYNASPENVALDNYHYFMSIDASGAFHAHKSMLDKHDLIVQNISIEKFNPYSNHWEDESHLIKNFNDLY